MYIKYYCRQKAEFMPMGNACYAMLLHGASWTKDGSKRVIPRNDVPFERVNNILRKFTKVNFLAREWDIQAWMTKNSNSYLEQY